MAKEGEVLKKIELKVCVDCCDGCKKKVGKVLQSVKGVLRTEINLQQQKVMVFGNIDSWVLIARLSRVGKQAEVWTQNAVSTNNKQSDQSSKDKRNDKQSSMNTFTKKEAIKEPVVTANGKENIDKTTKKNPQEPVLSKLEFNSFMPMPPTLLEGDPNQKARGNQYIYSLQAQPMGIPVLQFPKIMPNMAYYEVSSYVAPVPIVTNRTCYAQQNYAAERQSEAQTPLNHVGDYFIDENTGMPCDVKGHVM